LYRQILKGMDMTRKISILVSLLLSVVTWMFSSQAYALGLGEIKLNSHLNQPLDAEIKLTRTENLTEQEILAGLGSKADFDAAGVERTFLITQLRFNVITRPDGSGVVKVTTRKPIREPFMNFIVEVHWPSGRLLREYTLLLDPPLYTDALPPAIKAPSQANSQTAPISRQSLSTAVNNRFDGLPAPTRTAPSDAPRRSAASVTPTVPSNLNAAQYKIRA
jgi:pilus assembly protein FimV